MTSKRAEQIRDAMKQKLFVRFKSRFEPGYVRGYVLDVGPEFFLVAVTGEDCRFNGFLCLRVADTRKFSEDPYAEFAVAALRARGESLKRKPKIRLASIQDILRSAGKLSSAIVIERQKHKPGSSRIGRVLSVSDRVLVLLEIGPDAQWEEEPTEFLIEEVTVVGFGGGYEGALLLVGGEPKLSQPT